MTDTQSMSIVDSRSKPLVLEVGEYLFIRLWRWDEERLVRDAEDDFYKKSASGNPPPTTASRFSRCSGKKANASTTWSTVSLHRRRSGEGRNSTRW